MKNAEVITISDQDGEAAEKKAIDGFGANVERSDPNARAAIRKAMKGRNLTEQSTPTSDLNSALSRARALPPNQVPSDSSYGGLELQSDETETAPADQN